MGVSTFNGINVALRGLIAQQRALDTTTHNIANASTEGYTRQEAVLEAADPIANVSVHPRRLQ
jgi:flagellar hook-associated protein 1 FlgK